MSDFYVKTGGLTLLFIKHHGDDSYSYVRRPYYKHSYFATWAPLVGLMKPGRCYVVAGTHKVGSLQLNVCSVDGTKITTTNATATVGSNLLQINTSELRAGLYILTMSKNGVVFSTRKFTKQ